MRDWLVSIGWVGRLIIFAVPLYLFFVIVYFLHRWQ